MIQRETRISRIYETKNGEVIISFRYAFGELSVEDKENLKALWREDVSLTLAIDRFQDLNQTRL